MSERVSVSSFDDSLLGLGDERDSVSLNEESVDSVGHRARVDERKRVHGA